MPKITRPVSANANSIRMLTAGSFESGLLGSVLIFNYVWRRVLLEVRLPDGRTAWIQNSDVIRDPKPLTIDESIALAKRFLGLPYLWGGRSSYGYDCSGFTQMLVRSRGINMPRDADLQAAWEGIAAVDRKELRAGDLLFFGGSADKITHTGMYIGGGEFIHDTTNGHPVIQISRLDDQPWTRLLVACRRVK